MGDHTAPGYPPVSGVIRKCGSRNAAELVAYVRSFMEVARDASWYDHKPYSMTHRIEHIQIPGEGEVSQSETCCLGGLPILQEQLRTRVRPFPALCSDMNY